MTLSTHAAVGALVGVVVHSVPGAFVAGFASHFILDSIPHWDYVLASASYDKVNKLNTTINFNKNFLFDLIKISFDFFLGIVALMFVVWGNPEVIPAAAAGAAAAMLPDFLQFLYFKLPHGPIVKLQYFHVVTVHACSDLNNKAFLGISIQILIYIGAITTARLFIL